MLIAPLPYKSNGTRQKDMFKGGSIYKKKTHGVIDK